MERAKEEPGRQGAGGAKKVPSGPSRNGGIFERYVLEMMETECVLENGTSAHDHSPHRR